MDETILKIEDLCVKAGDREILKKVSFEVGKGRITGIAGPSGCGKTVLVKSIIGLIGSGLEVSAGKIIFTGREINKLKEKELSGLRGKDLALILQDPMTSLDPLMRIGEQVAEAYRIHKKASAAEARERAVQILKEVGFPDAEKRYGCYPHELSGGQRQRVLLAAAMILDPQLLLADEPTTSLDMTVERGILKLMKKMCRDHGTGILFITHNPRIIYEMCDDVYIMNEGRIVEAGRSDELFSAPKEDLTKELIDAAKKLYGTEADDKHAAYAAHVTVSDPLVSCRNLCKTYRINGNSRIDAMADVSLEIARGEILGLSGDSGCGKTTLAHTIMNLQKPDSGNVIFDGLDITGMTGRRFSKCRRRIQMVFQESYSSLDPQMTVRKIIAEPLLAYKLCTSKMQLEYRVRELLDETGLPSDCLDMYPYQLSGGQRQRVTIARAAALTPDLLICDEPVSSLDVAVIPKILELFKDMQNRYGMTYLFISHDPFVLRYISDRIITMKGGRICSE